MATGLGIIPGTFIYAGMGAGAGTMIAEGDTLTFGTAIKDPSIYLPIIGLAVF